MTHHLTVTLFFYFLSFDYTTAPAKETIRMEQDIFVPLASSGKLYVYQTTRFWSQIKSAGWVWKATQPARNFGPTSGWQGYDVTTSYRCGPDVGPLFRASWVSADHQTVLPKQNRAFNISLTVWFWNLNFAVSDKFIWKIYISAASV